MEIGVLEETEMDISRMVILVTDPLLKEDIQEKIIKMLQNLLRNIMILLERLYQTVIKFYLRTICSIQNTFLEFFYLKKIQVHTKRPAFTFSGEWIYTVEQFRGEDIEVSYLWFYQKISAVIT